MLQPSFRQKPQAPMASSTSNTTTNTSTMNDNSPTYGSSDPTSPNTTFVQADPSNFRTIVQNLTGSPDSPSTQKFPITHPARHAANTCPRRPAAFKLHERRQSAKNLQINLSSNNNNGSCCHSKNTFEQQHPDHMFQLGRHRGSFLVSPVSPLDLLISPSSPYEEELEEIGIAEKGFYFHASPLSAPRGADPPELLPLFPLTSPRLDNQEDDHHNDCSSSCS